MNTYQMGKQYRVLSRRCTVNGKGEYYEGVPILVLNKKENRYNCHPLLERRCICLIK